MPLDHALTPNTLQALLNADSATLSSSASTMEDTNARTALHSSTLYVTGEEYL